MVHFSGGRSVYKKLLKRSITKRKKSYIHAGTQGELVKLGIILDSKTIWNILQDFRKKGKIKSGLTWWKFIEMHKKSIYAMDFFLFHRRYCIEQTVLHLFCHLAWNKRAHQIRDF
jgi:hypothetical protein